MIRATCFLVLLALCCGFTLCAEETAGDKNMLDTIKELDVLRETLSTIKDNDTLTAALPNVKANMRRLTRLMKDRTRIDKEIMNSIHKQYKEKADAAIEGWKKELRRIGAIDTHLSDAIEAAQREAFTEEDSLP